MTIISHKIAALKTKKLSATYNLECRIEKEDFTEAVFLVNEYLKSDSVLKSILGNDFNIYPMIAEEPLGGNPSYPYIRYMSIPNVGPIWRVRTDIVRYMIGDKSYKQSGKIAERIIQLTNTDGSEAIFPLKNSKFKVQCLLFVGGSPTTGPDQEDGVMERGVNVALLYTVIG